jgi:hypothetical protein
VTVRIALTTWHWIGIACLAIPLLVLGGGALLDKLKHPGQPPDK